MALLSLPRLHEESYSTPARRVGDSGHDFVLCADALWRRSEPRVRRLRYNQREIRNVQTVTANSLPAGIAVRGDSGDELTQRIHEERPHAYRNPFARDGARVLHARAFRRLAGKTQVFTRVASEWPGDHFRSRLTHTLEVAQISRTLALALGLNTNLAEALALVHDIGHPPFGHAGEEALDGALRALWAEIRSQPACVAHRFVVRGEVCGFPRAESDVGRARRHHQALARVRCRGAPGAGGVFAGQAPAAGSATDRPGR